ncbi:MAG: DNA internalization-related competence protein ComEC/Rec2 [Deltaproteobacteria bacterium]|nr:DNA internalization-related competence protein ComEC/Rec2 [Deltaproteobacteria bacterium]
MIFFIAVSLFFSGILNITLNLHPRPPEKDLLRFIDKEKIVIEGMVCKNPEVSPHKTDLIVDIQRIIDDGTYFTIRERVLISVRLKDRSFQYGDYIRAKVKLRKPSNFNNPGGFDYERFLLFRGIRYRGSISRPIDIVTIRENTGNIFKASLERYRTRLRSLILANSSYPQNRILQALILGEKKQIPPEILDNFNRTGISHVLAISGLHIGIIAFLSILLVRMCMKTSEYLLLRFNIIKVSLVCSIAPIVSYALIAGLSISTVRATLMILSFLVAILIGRERDLLNTLAFAAFTILSFSPVSLFDVSFQLSFIAVASILLLTPALHSLLPKSETANDNRSHVRRYLKSIIIFIFVTFSATLGTTPLIAFYFNRISTITILSNMAIIPLIGFVVLPLGIIAAGTLPISTSVAALLIKGASFFAGISNSIISWLSHIPFSSFFVTTPSIPEILLYYSFILVAAKLINSRKARFAVTLAIVSLCIIGLFGYRHIKAVSAGELRATFIDVGQGSSTLVRFPGGQNMLVDGGGFYGETFDIGRSVVAPYLWHEGIQTIDIMVLTHPHQDHLAGLVFILKNFSVKEVWSNGKTTGSYSYKEFTKTIAEKNIPHRIVNQGVPETTIGGVTVRIGHPPKEETGFDANNNSVVMKIIYKDVEFLLPADIEEPAVRLLLLDGASLKSDILLAPHHGSYTPATPPFLEAVRPGFIVFSCGKENVFGYPARDILSICRKMGVTILRTDMNGAISFSTDGTEIRYSSSIP